MMKKTFLTLVALFAIIAVKAQTVTATWQYSDIDNLSVAGVVSGGETSTLLTPSYELGEYLTPYQELANSGADTDSGYEAVVYDPHFVTLQPSEQVSAKTEGHKVCFAVAPASGHKFMPTKVSFDACKVGTDNGGIDVVVSDGTTTITLGSVTPLRNKIQEGNSTGYSHHEFYVNDYNVSDEGFTLALYIMNVATNKEIGLRNIVIEGEMDSEIHTAGDYLKTLTFTGRERYGEAETMDLLPTVSALKNGESALYSVRLAEDPTNFAYTMNDAYASNCSATIDYADHKAEVSIENDGVEVLNFSVNFTIVPESSKGAPTPLKRGLMSLHKSSGNLVSWRARKTDDKNVRFMLYRVDKNGNESVLNSGAYIAGKTNFLDKTGGTSHTYRLEVLDENGNVLEEDTSGATWSNQTLYIPLSQGPPTDNSGLGATYTPNDCGICDMDGDGEYDIIVKWYPSNAKDAASSGSTSNIFFDCYKLDGTFMWRIDMGQNFFASAHTVQFIAWDFDGDGYGEFMVKTAPGTVDGLGNYVIMGDDDPTANWKNSRGKQVEGPEYITVFDGMTGAEISTIPYHTNYAAGADYWGDSEQNRSERYLAAIAWLDGEDANPSPIFARGYYSGAFVGAYDFDGTELKERWVSRNITSGQGLWGEGAHWISVGDCDGDGRQEIVYGAAALDDDGSLLYRTGLKHGDALHLGDFDPDHEGLEVYMVHEDGPYGMDLRDAATGELILHETGSSDTGRGLAAHLNPEAEGAYLMWSEDISAVYDWKWNLINSNIAPGGGGSLNNRIYWDGLLSEDRYDKSVLEAYSPSKKSFERITVNNDNYTVGTLNNDSKYNPCIMADILGDWREEIINWVEEDGAYSLVINATNYESDYTVPHLMDDGNYRAQVINQNCCYNQPPHLSYNLRNSKKINRRGLEYDTQTNAGKYWDCFYTTYPVIVPEGITAWKVTGVDAETDTLIISQIDAGKVLPAKSGIVFNTSHTQNIFVPSSLSTTSMSGSIIKGDYVDVNLPIEEGKVYYEFAVGEEGIGFYRTDGARVEGGTGYIVIDEDDNLADCYILGNIIDTVDGIEEIKIENTVDKDAPIYNLQGIRLNKVPEKGIYIQGGKKIVKQ